MRGKALGLTEAGADIRNGRRTSRQVVESALERYRLTEPEIHAFRWLDAERALRLADRRDHQYPIGPLHGVPIGVKDIFDTRGIPTQYGSRLFERRVPTRSSNVVLSLERAGAIVLGKTVTTEFAYMAPGPTRNPHDTSRTPGGSSQGSAAAVAAGVVAGAIGSQTNGSTIRPAAFCGIVGFKPTAGRVSRRGAMSFSYTLDQVGVFTRCVADAGLLAAILASDPPPASVSERAESKPRLALVPTIDWPLASDVMQRRFLEDAELLGAYGAQVEAAPLPIEIDGSVDMVAELMAYESMRTIGRKVPAGSPEISTEIRDLWVRGARIAKSDHAALLRRRRRLIATFQDWIAPYDALITLPAAGEAPDLSTTGDPRFCSRWTLLGAPAIVIPTGHAPSGLPLGLQFVGRRGGDDRLLAVARWAEGVFAGS